MSRRVFVLAFLITWSALLRSNQPPAHVADASPISSERVTINLGYPLLAPTWGSTILTRAKLWKTYLPNVEVNREEFMSGMPVVNNMVAGKIDIGYFADMPAIALASKANLTDTIFISLTDADEGGASVVYVKKGSPITDNPTSGLCPIRSNLTCSAASRTSAKRCV